MLLQAAWACYPLKTEEKSPTKENQGCRRDKTRNFNETDSQDQSFFFSPALISLFFSLTCSEKWQSAFLITVFLSCVLSNGAQLWWPISFGVLCPRGLNGRRAVCLFLPFANTIPRLIQHHSPFLLSTPGGSSWHLADATGDKLYGVLNGHLMATFCHLIFTCTPPQSLKDPYCTLTI